MKKTNTTVVVLIVSALISACSPSNQLVTTAPQSQQQVGEILNGPSATELQEYLQVHPTVRYRVVNAEHNLYEIYGATQTELKKAFPGASVQKNQFYRLFDEKPAGSPLEPIKTCVGREKPEAAESPSAMIAPIVESDAELSTVKLGEKVGLTGKNSKAHPRHQSTLRLGWIILVPTGSQLGSRDPQLGQVERVLGPELNFKPDAMGLYKIALVAQDERNVCDITVHEVVVTDNKPFVAANINVNDLRQAIDIKLFKHLTELKADEAWQTSEGKGLIIAVVDSGVNYNHPLLNSNIAINEKEIPENGIDDDKNGFIDDVAGFDFANSDPYPFDDHGHGSHVAGLAASPVIGMARAAKILPLKALSPLGGDAASLAGAIMYAADQGAKIINMSFGSYGYAHPKLVEAIDYAEKKGALLVAAAGNGHPYTGQPVNTDDIPSYPSCLPNDAIISVAAKDSTNLLAPYSNYGLKSVDVVAPGGGSSGDDLMVSTFSHNPAGILLIGMAGTSMASPVVSGIAAQVWALNPQLTALQVKAILLKAGQEKEELKRITVSGRYISALGALKSVQPPRAPARLHLTQVH